ncbi:MAG: PspC domain-containing protein [Candidatus Marinimicrobia bacterium]|nr:PspC domain-containing protein [Candidatus Neomarinimicrobiota bacterium]
MTKKCKFCGNEISEDFKYCPYCGKTFEIKKLTRSKDDRKILGICGGLGKYFNIDSNIIRIIAAIIIIYSGIIPGLVVYFLLGLFIPED